MLIKRRLSTFWLFSKKLFFGWTVISLALIFLLEAGEKLFHMEPYSVTISFYNFLYYFGRLLQTESEPCDSKKF